MNKTSKIFSLSLLASCLFVVAGCSQKPVDKDNLVFSNKNIVLDIN